METITTAAEAGSFFMSVTPYFIIALSFTFAVAVVYIKMQIAKIGRRKNK